MHVRRDAAGLLTTADPSLYMTFIARRICNAYDPASVRPSQASAISRNQRRMLHSLSLETPVLTGQKAYLFSFDAPSVSYRRNGDFFL